MKIASWNVNSVKVRAPQVVEFLNYAQPDVLGLQELKVTDENFPHQAFLDVGYQAWSNGQKTYNGVALLVKQTLASEAQSDSVTLSLPNFEDQQRRVIAITVGDTRIINLYVPNGQEVGSDKFAYKLAWFEALTDWISDELNAYKKLAIMGDFNIAPKDEDVHDPDAWRGKVLFSEQEHAAFEKLVALGLDDSFRLFDQPEHSFSWWDYRMNAFRRKMGVRIDLILTSKTLSKNCIQAGIDPQPRSWERPSDHTPAWVEFKSP